VCILSDDQASAAMGRVSEPNPVDCHVGRAIRLRRHELGVSQQALAARLGISFQQVQKYERGANRISASMLYAAAKALGIPPGAFFAGLETADGDGAAEELVRDMLAQPGGLRMAAAWLATTDQTVRMGLLGLARAVARSGRR
jgi:transcriptional regulator with XRE-family HTH domain